MRKTSRRSFAAAIAAASAGLPLLSRNLPAQSPPAAPPPPSPLAEALGEVVKAEFGAFLTTAELESIEKDYREAMPALQRLRDVKLANSDEPDFTFAPLAKRW